MRWTSHNPRWWHVWFAWNSVELETGERPWLEWITRLDDGPGGRRYAALQGLKSIPSMGVKELVAATEAAKEDRPPAGAGRRACAERDEAACACEEVQVETDLRHIVWVAVVEGWVGYCAASSDVPARPACIPHNRRV